MITADNEPDDSIARLIVEQIGKELDRLSARYPEDDARVTPRALRDLAAALAHVNDYRAGRALASAYIQTQERDGEDPPG